MDHHVVVDVEAVDEAAEEVLRKSGVQQGKIPFARDAQDPRPTRQKQMVEDPATRFFARFIQFQNITTN